MVTIPRIQTDTTITTPVTVIGTTENLAHFLPTSLHVTGNFSNVKVGTNTVPIDVQNGDPNITIVAPNSVQVNVDDLGSSTQTVSIERVNALPSGFHEQTTATTITPATVRVDGPKSQLGGIQAVVIIDLAVVGPPGNTQPFTVQVWNAVSGRSLLSYQKHTRPVWTVTWSPGGGCLASATGNNSSTSSSCS